MGNNIKIVLILEDIRSVLNVGAIFRTSDALNISKIYLTGITPAPLDRFGRIRNDFHKTALGAEKTVSWEQVDSIVELIISLKKDGFEIVSVEQSKKSIDYKKTKVKGKTAIIFGSETLGVTKRVLEMSDKIIEIPMKGGKESLNVSVSAGIVLFRLLDN